MYDIRFPHLGITIEHLKNSFNIGPVNVAYYGLIIGMSIVVGMFFCWYDAKRRGQNPDMYSDFIIYGIIGGVLGARIFYVAFQWDYYSQNLKEIFNLRGGGLAIYGAVIGGLLALIIYCKIKKINPVDYLDTLVFGILFGQIAGRWGNFFNCEAFGGYTDCIFAMRIRLALVSNNMLNADVLAHKIIESGVEYIQVHPTFFYESALNLCLLIFLLIYRKHKKFNGELFIIYVGGYGIIRAFVEGMRTDSLMIWNTGLRISQLIGICAFIGAILWWRYAYKKSKKNKLEANAEPVDTIVPDANENNSKDERNE